MKITAIAILLVMSFVWAAAQPAEINNLRNQLTHQQQHKGYENDTAYIKNLAQLAHLFYAQDVDSLFFYAYRALDLAKKIKYAGGIAESLRQIGNGYLLTGDFAETLSYYQQSLSIAEEIKDNRLICFSLSNIGLDYQQMGKYDDALEYSLKALKLAEALGDSLRITGELSNLADIYFVKKEYQKAFNQAYSAIQMAKTLKNDYYEAFLTTSLATMLYSAGKYHEAFGYCAKPLKFYISTNDVLGITNTDLLLSKIYLKLHNYDSSLIYALQSFHLAQSKKGKKDIADAAQTLADIFEAKGDNKNALLYLKTAKTYNDSLFNDQSQKKLFELQAKYKYEQEEAILKIEQAKKDLATTATVNSQKQQIVIAALVIFTLAWVIFSLYQSRAEKLRKNLVLEEKNIEIVRQKEEIEKKSAALSISNGQKDKLFSLIAHDLRSPFISLQSLLTLFKDDALPIEEVKEILLRLNVNVDYTVELVTNLLYWASTQMDGFSVKGTSFLLNNVVTDVFAGMQKPAADKDVALLNKITTTATVFADKDMITLVIRNLLSNAVKFCHAGGLITVSVEIKEHDTEVCVADTGPGITENVLQKIRNGESITTFGTSKEKGTGLGLLLCKDFIARNHGLFRIESVVGKGSNFYFTVKNAV